MAIVAFVAGLLLGDMLRPPAALSMQPARGPQMPATERTPIVGATAYPVDVLRIIDGDTFEARVRVWPGLEITTKVRLRDIDAPELRARCAEERTKAEAARAALSALLAEGDIRISNVTLDKYGGRVVAGAATRRTSDVSQALLATGYVRRYDGGRRESWCGLASRDKAT